MTHSTQSRSAASSESALIKSEPARRRDARRQLISSVMKNAKEDSWVIRTRNAKDATCEGGVMGPSETKGLAAQSATSPFDSVFN